MAIMNARSALLPSNVLTIDSSLRTITIPDKICNLGVETDANVQRLRFTMPRYYDTVDLDGFAIRINYQNAKGEGDVYAVTDAETTADSITFSWLVGPHAMACKGKVKFIVCLKKLDAAGNVTQAYHTTVASLPVLEGLETCECIVEEHPDVLEQILLRLDNLEKNGTGTGGNTGTVVASGVTYLESPDAAGNYLYLRDLETGPYVLSGYFRPFEGSSHSLGFSKAVVSVTRKDAGSHVMVLSALNCIVNFLEILVDDTAEGGHTYTRTNISLPTLHGLVERVEALENKSRIVDVELLAANWTGDTHPYSQVVAIEGATANSQVDLTPSVEQLTVFYEKDVTFVAENVGGVVTVYAIGQKPANDYTIQATVTEVTT